MTPPARPSRKITPVIMSGGSGTRLWPMSTAAAPKQFHPLWGSHSMLADTLERVAPAADAPFTAPVVICSADHEHLVLAACAAAGVEPLAVVLEPMGRNTAAAAYIAARVVEALPDDALVLLLPADHVIRDRDGFRQVVARAARVAEQAIVTFGIEPHGPETGYGYIKQDAPLGDGVYRVARFAEKPDRSRAEAYLAEGGYSWNAGIFLYAPEIMISEMARHAPEIAATSDTALQAATRRGVAIDLQKDTFALCPSVAVDVAVMEPTDRAGVAPCDIGWTDVGSWSELWRMGPHDDAANRLTGDGLAVDSSGNLIWSDGVPVSVIGVDNLIVVATPEGVMVARMDRAQDVKRLVDARKAASKS